MKTLFLYSVHLLMFCACTCIFGIPQPRQRPDGLNNVENIFKKCQEVYDDITKNSFLEQDTLLCFGLKVFSQQFPGGVPESEVFEEVQKQSDTDVCEHFQEMMLNSPLGNMNNSVVIYNQQFRDKNTCERVCLDIMEHVNPICSILLALSLHSKENRIGSGAQTPSTTLPGQKADNDDDGVSEQSRNVMGQVPNRIPDEQKPKASGKGVVTDEEKAQASKEQKLHGDDKSPVQMTESNHQEQTSQGINSASAVDVGKLDGLTQQVNLTGPGSVKEKPKVTSGQEMPVAGRAKDESSSGTQEGNALTTTNMNIVSDRLKKTENLKKDSNNTRGLVTENENQGKPDTLSGEKEPQHSSVALPESSDDNKNDQVTATGSNVQEKISTIENRLTSKKVDTAHQKGASISKVPNVEEDKGVVYGKKSQAENKETESSPQDEAEIQISSMTEIMPKSNIDEQTTTQNNGKAYTNENSQTAQQSGRDGTQKAVSEEMQFTENTGAGVQEQDTHNPEDGESNDNTGYPSGGGTGLDYGTPDSDAFDVDKNNMGAGTAVIRGKYDDDSHFFAYFMTTMVFCIVGYLLFHNKQKILALALEGRSRRGRRRPNTSGYRKLDSNLEEAISSSKSASVTQVIY